MNKRQKRNLLFWSFEFVIFLVLVSLCFHLSFIIQPLISLGSSIVMPVLVAGILFYLLNPIKKQLMKIHITLNHKKYYVNSTFATSIIFIVLAALITIACIILIPDLLKQIANLIQNMPDLTKHAEESLTHFSHKGVLRKLPLKQYTERLQGYITDNAKTILANLSGGVSQIISMATNVIVDTLSIIVILFFMLKDGSKFTISIGKFLPKNSRKPTLILLSKMSHTISKYIDGQLIECCFVGGFTILGFLIIHQPFAVLLGMVGGLCVIIPYVGAFIGIAPAILVAFTVNIWQVLWVIIVVIIVEQIDGNLIYPNVIGKSEHIHPLTIVIILLAVGKVMGILGMILAIPVYAILKTVVIYLHHIFTLKYQPMIKKRHREEKKRLRN